MSDELSLREAITTRPADPADWPAIGRLAQVAVEHLVDAASQEEWTQARRAFSGWRKHWVATTGGEILGYTAVERSDVCAVPAASVILENVVAFELAAALIDKFGGDSVQEMQRRWKLFHQMASLR